MPASPLSAHRGRDGARRRATHAILGAGSAAQAGNRAFGYPSPVAPCPLVPISPCSRSDDLTSEQGETTGETVAERV